jgi:2-dehydropantoate 2-reductase
VGEVLRLLASLQQLSPDCSLPYLQLLQQLHLKLAVNCCANPITALLRCRLGGAVDSRDVLLVQRRVCEEVGRIFGDELQQLGAQELYDEAVRVQQINRLNTTSMLQDVLARRGTEIEYINGYVAKRAAAMGLAAPYNELLWRLVRAKQEAEEVGLQQ